MKRAYPLFFLPALGIIILDQLTKLAVIQNIGVFESIPVIENFFHLVHVKNRGMAFGIMNRPEVGFGLYFLIGASCVAIVFILYWFTRLKPEDKGLTIGLSLILGGAVGNLIDRIRLKEVIDFLDFFIGTHHWASFNIADAAVTVGTFYIAVNIIFFNSLKE